MGSTISAKNISNALAKARDLGFVEESFTLGDVVIVLRNLRADEYSAIVAEQKNIDSVETVFQYQQSHICRAIVEINGADLREADFIEVEEEVKDKASGEMKTRLVKVERHEFLRKNVISGWSRETLQVAWRKLSDVIKLADEKTKDGVKFIIPEETPEERFRVLVGDLRDVMSDVPEGIVSAVLEDAGLMRISTADEVKRAMERADELRRQQEAENPPPQVPREQEAPPVRTPGRPTPEELMAQRTPLNRQPMTGVPQAPPAAPQAQPVAQGQPVAPPPPVIPQVAPKLSQRLAELEDLPMPPPGDPSMTLRHVAPGGPQAQPNAPHLQTANPSEVPVLSQKGREKVNMDEFNNIVESKKPIGGINPRFRPPPRGM